CTCDGGHVRLPLFWSACCGGFQICRFLLRWISDLRLYCLRGLQFLERRANVRIQSGAALRKVREDRCAHPRVPEFLDVLGGAGDSLLGALAREEFADLVGHINELLIMRHWSRCLRCFL